MERYKYDDTIFALATPPGVSSVAVIRVSGREARGKVGDLLVTRAGAPILLETHRVHHAHVRDPRSGALVDEVVILYMAAPRSFTREDVVEIQCHGSMVVVRAVLALLERQGLRHAEPGEFTRRAFLNGRLGLPEAEGINDLVHALSESSARVALDQMHGSLRQKIGGLRRILIDLTALIEANMDFPEEDIEILDRAQLERDIDQVLGEVGALGATFRRGRMVRLGIRTLITGRPNAGKSSLLNALLKSERAIVSEVPGTTRDTIEETLSFGGILFSLVDSAGLRSQAEPLEALGIERTRQELRRADLVLYLVDRSQPVTPEDLGNVALAAGIPLLVIENKADLPEGPGPTAAASFPEVPRALVSARTGEGVEALMDRILALTRDLVEIRDQETILTNDRHRTALEAAEASLRSFKDAVLARVPLDVALLDLYEATRELGVVIGEVVTEDILDRIFERFCIGK